MAEPTQTQKTPSEIEKLFSTQLTEFLRKAKEENERERLRISKEIAQIKENREENLLKIADLREGIDKLDDSVKDIEENNDKIIKASVGTQKNRKLDILHKEKVLEMIKREEKNEYLSWDLMTRLYAHIFNASKNELIELSEQEQKGIA